jgi:hypothetical protein
MLKTLNVPESTQLVEQYLLINFHWAIASLYRTKCSLTVKVHKKDIKVNKNIELTIPFVQLPNLVCFQTIIYDGMMQILIQFIHTNSVFPHLFISIKSFPQLRYERKSSRTATAFIWYYGYLIILKSY